MFKNEADFKKLVSRLNIDDKANPAHRENLRRQMISAFDEAAQKSATRIIDFRTFGRIIMKSKITKLAAAAVIIIAAIMTIHYLGGSTTNVAWADVAEQISNHTKYKCRQRYQKSEVVLFFPIDGMEIQA